MRNGRFLWIGIICLLFYFEAGSADQKKICLNMIVKNESAVICRCLASVKPIIDYWVIVDTGSNDNTQSIIKEFMKDIPGELHERPWVDFAHNRNQALELAKDKADYILFIDADEVLLFTPNFQLEDLDKDFYYITTEYSGTRYERLQLISNRLDWKWIGVLHETVCSPQAKTYSILKGVTNFVNTDGFRSKDPEKYKKDAKILETALKEDPTNKRYMFYLAQSYKDAEEHELALKNYEKRIAMGGWDQEVFYSMLQVGILQEALEKDPETVTKSYLQAYLYRPKRAEPLYRLANYHRRGENYAAGYVAAQHGLAVPLSDDILFVEHWMNDYGLLLELSICAYWTEKYTEAMLASKLLLANPSLPKYVRECVEKNLVWINSKLALKNENFQSKIAANKELSSLKHPE